VDGSGNVYIVDFSNYRVLKEDFADPPSLTFASTQVGQTSSDSPQTVTLQNYGNTALTFPVPASGNDPSISANFALNNSEEPACPLVSAGSTAGVLAAGASCLLPISFTPATTGSFDGALTLTDNNLNAASPNYAVQSIRLIGATPGLPIITSVSAILPQQTQTITINGSGFGTHSPYKGDSNFIALSDTTGNHFTAGYTGNAIGLGVSSWTDTQIVLTSLTGGYGTNGWCIRPGDQLEVRVWNAGTSDGPAVYPLVATGTDTCAPVITSVSPIGSAQTQTITITGSGFGSHSPYNGDSNFIALSDTTGNHFTAGYTGNAIGLDVSSWTNTQIVLTSLTGGYGTNGWCIRPGDQLDVRVWNVGTSGGPAIYPLVATGTNTCP
jgi:hypothetical protein